MDHHFLNNDLGGLRGGSASVTILPRRSPAALDLFWQPIRSAVSWQGFPVVSWKSHRQGYGEPAEDTSSTAEGYARPPRKSPSLRFSAEDGSLTRSSTKGS